MLNICKIYKSVEAGQNKYGGWMPIEWMDKPRDRLDKA